MKRIALMMLVSGVAHAASWTCSSLCGYMGGAGLVTVTPLKMVIGNGEGAEAAYEATLQKCAPLIPKDMRPFLVKRVSITTTKFSDTSTFGDPVTVKEACEKD